MNNILGFKTNGETPWRQKSAMLLAYFPIFTLKFWLHFIRTKKAFYKRNGVATIDHNVGSIVSWFKSLAFTPV